MIKMFVERDAYTRRHTKWNGSGQEVPGGSLPPGAGAISIAGNWS